LLALKKGILGFGDVSVGVEVEMSVYVELIELLGDIRATDISTVPVLDKAGKHRGKILPVSSMDELVRPSVKFGEIWVVGPGLSM